MLEALYFADIDSEPCEVVEFEYLAQQEELFDGRKQVKIFLLAIGEGKRIELGRVYSILTSINPEDSIEDEPAFHSVWTSLYDHRAVATEITAESSLKVYYESGFLGGIFFKSKERAQKMCVE